MLLPISWLKQFIDVKATPEQMAEKLTLSGSEVERIIRPSAGLSRVVVGEIKEIKPHPQAEKLQLAYVDVGKKGLVEIVCGAPNIKVGQKAPAVLVGGSVPGAKIEPREIRGVKSHGMLASGRELGVSDDRAGIFILPSAAKVGEDVVKLLQLDEPILELEITPNRADCFSVIGLAREVAALFNIAFKIPAVHLMEAPERASRVVKVSALNHKLCPKYTARVIENVKVGPSPLWLANRLRQVGVKSINNIVDITNFVMMETGQPLHAFDFDGLEADKRGGQRGLTRIIVRSSRAGEKILALDGNSYNLTQSMLVIADAKSPIAIAGVMGGQETGVADNTKNIILEAAVFDAASVRRTGRALGLRSESSARFEKGVDLSAVEAASARAAQLISDLAGGTVLRGSIVVGGAKPTGPIIKTSLSEINRLLGVPVKEDKVKAILQSLGFTVTPPPVIRRGWPTPPPPRPSPFAIPLRTPSPRLWSVSDQGFGGQEATADKRLRRTGRRGGDWVSVEVPSWRRDVREGADLVEEIGRMIDYNTLPKTLPSSAAQSPALNKSYELRRRLRQHLAAAGFSEILTYSFYDEKLANLSGAVVKDHVVVTNPVNKEYKYLRASLAPAMFEKLSQNSSLLPRDEFRLFEIGKVFSAKGGERWQAAVGLIDIKAAHEQLYRRLRGILEGFINGPTEVSRSGDSYDLSAPLLSFPRPLVPMHIGRESSGFPSRTGMTISKSIVARIVIKNKEDLPLRLRSSLGAMIINLGALEKIWQTAPVKFAPLPIFPVVERDLAILTPNEVQYKEIAPAMDGFNPLLKKIALFDVYHGLSSGTSLAFRLSFASADRTLESKEVDEIIESLKKDLIKKYKITFR